LIDTYDHKISSTELKQFTLIRWHFSQAVDLHGSLLFDDDGVLLFGLRIIEGTASGLSCNWKFMLYPIEAANALLNTKSEPSKCFSHTLECLVKM